MLYKNEKFSTKKYDDLPLFNFKNPESASASKALIPLFIFSSLIILIGIAVFKKKLKMGTIINL
ncbi:MAG TPA: hypothetical protein DDY16_04635 [Tenacibaculum sp.]|nr:hypothetical protein [Tenacibaculum sp.]